MCGKALHCLVLLAAMSTPLFAFGGEPHSGAAGLQNDIVFDDYSPLSRGTELTQRLLSPLNAMRVRLESALPGQALREQAIDLAREKFIVYVPPNPPPPNGYGLLVFVPPWPQAAVPHGWTSALDRHDVIFVSAANSGDDADVLDRRVPLALLAEANIARRYPLDPQRIYIGGFSGGSRIALRLALAYPDVFRGALLDAGSDPIGDAQVPLPSADLFHRFQESTRLVYLTGADDTLHLDQARRSEESLRGWCVFDLDSETMPLVGHEPANPSGLDRALRELGEHSRPGSNKFADCRSHIDQELDAQLRQARSSFENGKTDDAKKLLEKIDARYGGLAASRSVELMTRFDARH